MPLRLRQIGDGTPQTPSPFVLQNPRVRGIVLPFGTSAIEPPQPAIPATACRSQPLAMLIHQNRVQPCRRTAPLREPAPRTHGLQARLLRKIIRIPTISGHHQRGPEHARVSFFDQRFNVRSVHERVRPDGSASCVLRRAKRGPKRTTSYLSPPRGGSSREFAILGRNKVAQRVAGIAQTQLSDAGHARPIQSPPRSEGQDLGSGVRGLVTALGF